MRESLRSVYNKYKLLNKKNYRLRNINLVILIFNICFMLIIIFVLFLEKYRLCWMC
jgi:hypothetical protein